MFCLNVHLIQDNHMTKTTLSSQKQCDTWKVGTIPTLH